jgi:hypothetical protein
MLDLRTDRSSVMRIAIVRIASGLALAAALCASPAGAHVASIDGAYDSLLGDSPDIVIHNTSAFAFTNVLLTLHGYQGANLGKTQSTTLGDIAAGADSAYIWNGTFVAGNLFSFDYDDSYAGTPFVISDPGCTIPGGGAYCARVGNFSVTFTALWNGHAIFSQFSPATNATGGFVGWEGLDPTGLSETAAYDVHNGTVGGTLAYIDVGKPGVPEPASWALMLLGFGGLGAVLRRRRQLAMTA